MRSVVCRDFGEPGRGDGARSVWLCEDHFAGMREELTGDFVNGFVAKRSIKKPDFAAGEILLEESGEFARCAGIVRAIEVDVGAGLQFFQPAGPNGTGDPLTDGVGGDTEAAVLQTARCGQGVESILQLKTAGQIRSDFERSA